MRSLGRGLYVICFTLALTTLCALAQTSPTAHGDPFLNRFQGTWQGQGKTFGFPSRLLIKWEWVLGNKFLRLSLRSEVTQAAGRIQIFEGHAYYQPAGDGKYEGKWFDSRGVSFPIKAHAEGDALIAFWGSPDTEQGRSIYRLAASGKLEIVDSSLQKNGTWKDFAHYNVNQE